MRPPETILVSRALVEEFAGMEPCPGDRPLRQSRLEAYDRINKAGELRTVTWASALCEETNYTYRVNGKHTSTLLSRLPALPPVYVTVERYVVTSLTDVAALYNTFDSRLAARDTRDINSAVAKTIPELRDLPDVHLRLAVSAAAFHADASHGARLTAADKAELLITRIGFALWLREVVPGNRHGMSMNNNRHLLRVAVAQAMLATYDRAPDKATEFWSLVRSESDANPESVTRQLARYLTRAVTAGGNTGAARRNRRGEDRKVAGNTEMYVKCLRGWNAWRSGTATNFKFSSADPLPVAL